VSLRLLVVGCNLPTAVSLIPFVAFLYHVAFWNRGCRSHRTTHLFIKSFAHFGKKSHETAGICSENTTFFAHFDRKCRDDTKDFADNDTA